MGSSRDISEEGSGIRGTSSLGEEPGSEYVDQDRKENELEAGPTAMTAWPTFTRDQMLRNQALEHAYRIARSDNAVEVAEQLYKFLKGE